MVYQQEAEYSPLEAEDLEVVRSSLAGLVLRMTGFRSHMTAEAVLARRMVDRNLKAVGTSEGFRFVCSEKGG